MEQENKKTIVILDEVYYFFGLSMLIISSNLNRYVALLSIALIFILYLLRRKIKFDSEELNFYSILGDGEKLEMKNISAIQEKKVTALTSKVRIVLLDGREIIYPSKVTFSYRKTNMLVKQLNAIKNGNSEISSELKTAIRLDRVSELVYYVMIVGSVLYYTR